MAGVGGNENLVPFIESQRDTYKYIHDQALRLANKGGYTPLEAAEVIELPDELGRKWYNRGYHGTLHHDVRAVYTKELGMWDGDPVSLHPHPPVESAKRFVDLLGAQKILDEGKRAFDAADYRWAAEILHKLVFAQPENAEARNLQADVYEQMGYQAEGPQWRGIYLSAALELREGAQPAPVRHGKSGQCPRDAHRHPLRLRCNTSHRRQGHRRGTADRFRVHRSRRRGMDCVGQARCPQCT